ncbi:S1 family peptidase [Variovorax boronicumulans]
MNKESPSIRDVVLPIFLGSWKKNEFEYRTITGTAFSIGKRGFALTAAHVIDQIADDGGDSAVGAIDADGRWTPIRILSSEKHPSEDVAIVQLSEVPHPSWLVVSGEKENQSCTYDSWGYPIVIAELSKKYEEEGMDSPELVYTHGYIRRRISRGLPMSVYRGAAFYEISDIAGDGCSGGPVIKRESVGRPTWNVIGMYIGAAQIGGLQAAYATRADAFAGWCPQILNRTVSEESRDL